MPKQHLPYHSTGYFSKLMRDYLAETSSTTPFYHRFPKLENFEAQIKEKKSFFTNENREVLVSSLTNQYKGFDISEATQKNIDSLNNENTFTVTTGHQLNLFTGPLYFLYKIFSVINLAEALSENHSEQHFVPVYWMATEDHDFDEIKYFNLFGKKVTWERESGGAVGELSTEGLDEVLQVLTKQIGSTVNANKLVSLFAESYSKHSNLADATRYLGNKLFAEYGLVILDGNDSNLKKLFVPYAEKELFENTGFKEVTKTTQRLIEAGYGEQVHPRDINLFYLSEGSRERIVFQDEKYFINNTNLVFSKAEILDVLNNHPERFSPNALLRPLYQEVILPNLCYTGGGGELAYWLQLKDYFAEVKVPFPMLLLRNSVLLVSLNVSEKLKRLEVDATKLFQKQHQLKAEYTHQLSEIKIDFTAQRTHLEQQFKDLYTLAEQTDASFLGAVGAQEKKQINGLNHLEKRLLQAQKRKMTDKLDRLTSIQDELFPKHSLQERNMNFSEFYLEYGEKLLTELKENLDPLCGEFTVLTL